MRTIRTRRVEVAMMPELVEEIDACRADMPRSRWIENTVKMWLGYRLDLEVLAREDAHDENHIPLDFELIEYLYERCIGGRDKPEDALRRLYGLKRGDRLAVRKPAPAQCVGGF